jgi:two-component system cell cycle sensor histidine kinase/response regulator CckA
MRSPKSPVGRDRALVLGFGLMKQQGEEHVDQILELDHQSVFFRCVEDSNDSIMVSDRRGRLVYVNPSWQRVYGYTAEQAIGKTPRLLHSGIQDDEFYRDMWSRISDPAVGYWKGELFNRARDGTLIPVLLTITPFKSDQGELLGYMGIAVDISWRRELEAKISHQDRLATIGTLVSGLAHEIGTPLGVIRGRAEILQMQSQDPLLKRSVDIILGQSDRISRIIQSLLKLSRGSQEKARIEPVCLNELVDEVLTLLSGPIRHARVETTLEINPADRALIDASRFEQVLMNLIVNAIHAIEQAAKDHSDHPRRIRIAAAECSSCEPGRWIELRVEDSGCGIQSEHLKQIFQPFFTTKEVGQGTGLGLAISLKLLQEMQAMIDVESEVGRGTAFVIKLKRP